MIPQARSLAPCSRRDGALGQLPRGALEVAIAASLLLFVLRMHASTILAFGDSEALYASYALFPQPAYLDHPGLISVVARWLLFFGRRQ